jgi:hypothetical protein
MLSIFPGAADSTATNSENGSKIRSFFSLLSAGIVLGAIHSIALAASTSEPTIWPAGLTACYAESWKVLEQKKTRQQRFGKCRKTSLSLLSSVAKDRFGEGAETDTLATRSTSVRAGSVLRGYFNPKSRHALKHGD